MSDAEERYWAVVPAAGQGSRMGGAVPKQYLPLNGRPVIEHTLARLGSHAAIRGIVVAIAEHDRCWPGLALPDHIPVVTAPGGAARHLSVLNALRVLTAEARGDDWVLVHDAARPCVRVADIARLIEELRGHPVGGLLGVPLADTVKRVAVDGAVRETVERTGLWRALTPQMFRIADLIEAIEAAGAARREITDEASAIEFTGRAPRIVAGCADNIKITAPEDLPLAAAYLEWQEAQGRA